jgi:hypothetical protein
MNYAYSPAPSPADTLLTVCFRAPLKITLRHSDESRNLIKTMDLWVLRER